MRRILDFKNLSIGRKFTVSFLLYLMVPLLVVFLWINSTVTEKIREENCKTNFEILKQTRTSLDNMIQDAIYVSLQVIGNEDLQQFLTSDNLEKNRKDELEKSIKYDINTMLNSRKYISSLSIYEEDCILFQFGKYLTRQPEEYLSEMEAQKGRVLWKPAEVSDIYAFSKDREYETGIYRVINSHDVYEERLAYERLTIDEEYIASLYAGISGESTEQMFIVDKEGNIISSLNKELLGKNMKKNSWFDRVISGEEGYFDADGGKSLVSYYRLDETDWYVVKQDSYAMISNYGQTNVVILLCIVISVIFAIAFYRMQRKRIIVPLIRLAGDVSRFEEGHYQIGTYSESTDEIGKLNNNFISMGMYIQDLIEKVYKSQLREKEAQLKYLQSQINPHFLYNTLDSMRWMAVKKKQYDLAEQIEALSNHFKHALNEGREFTTVEKEVKHLNDYLTIQKNRFGDRIKETIMVEEEVLECRVLNLILQPLVENAIVHGLEGKLSDGKINIIVKKEDNVLLYVVEDNGLGADQEMIRKRLSDPKESHNALALDNINQRIQCTYGEQYGVTFESEIGTGTKVTVTMPMEYEGTK